MKFLNRYVWLHAAIVLIATLSFYGALFLLSGLDNPTPLAICATGLYIAVIVISTLINNRRDMYQGYFGFNYHLVTYVVVCSTAALLIAAGVLLPENRQSLGVMAGCWGIGILVHLLIVLIIFRKRRIRDYDRKEIFS